jgi:hypothetical protein
MGILAGLGLQHNVRTRAMVTYSVNGLAGENESSLTLRRRVGAGARGDGCHVARVVGAGELSWCTDVVLYRTPGAVTGLERPTGQSVLRATCTGSRDRSKG